MANGEWRMARGSEKKTNTFLSLVSVSLFISRTILSFFILLAHGTPFYTVFIT
jgi:hypothetical protein